MTPEQALQILDQAASLAHLVRNDHKQVMDASKTLSDYLLNSQPKKTKGPQ